jgi:hypothetical protein
MVENHPKSSKVTLNATKNFTKSHVFGHHLFISGPSQLAHAKITEKRPNKSKKSYSNLSVFDIPKWIFISGGGHLGTLKNLIKIIEISPKKLLKLLKKRSKFQSPRALFLNTTL